MILVTIDVVLSQRISVRWLVGDESVNLVNGFDDGFCFFDINVKKVSSVGGGGSGLCVFVILCAHCGPSYSVVSCGVQAWDVGQCHGVAPGKRLELFRTVGCYAGCK